MDRENGRESILEKVSTRVLPETQEILEVSGTRSRCSKEMAQTQSRQGATRSQEVTSAV